MATIAAYCYTAINGSDNSMIIQTSERSAQIFLRRLSKNIELAEVTAKKEEQKIKEEKKIEKKFHERDLHTILVAFANTDTHFKAYLKTIFHENSNKGVKGLNEWFHPDLVGVYFPFRDYRKETFEIQHHLSISSIRLFSFVIKINLTFTNLREYYFQAASNSSWAYEGYLVTLKLDEDPTLKDEIRRLNNAFGIGVIRLNPDNICESEILFPSGYNQEIDLDTVNKMSAENSDFSSFLSELTEDITLKNVKSKNDSILSPDDIEKYINNKGIRC